MHATLPDFVLLTLDSKACKFLFQYYFALSHSDQIVDIADGLNKLLPSDSPDNSDNNDVAGMIEKGQEIIGDTLNNINKNMKSWRDKERIKNIGLFYFPCSCNMKSF